MSKVVLYTSTMPAALPNGNGCDTGVDSTPSWRNGTADIDLFILLLLQCSFRPGQWLLCLAREWAVQPSRHSPKKQLDFFGNAAKEYHLLYTICKNRER